MDGKWHKKEGNFFCSNLPYGLRNFCFHSSFCDATWILLLLHPPGTDISSCAHIACSDYADIVCKVIMQTLFVKHLGYHSQGIFCFFFFCFQLGFGNREAQSLTVDASERFNTQGYVLNVTFLSSVMQYKSFFTLFKFHKCPVEICGDPECAGSLCPLLVLAIGATMMADASHSVGRIFTSKSPKYFVKEEKVAHQTLKM